MSTPGNNEVGESPSHRDKTRSYAAGSFALELGEEPTRPRGQGILIGLLVFLLLSLFLFAFSLFGPGGDVRRFFDVFLPGDPTFVVASPPDGDVVIFGDGAGGRRLPDGNMPYCEQVMMTQDKLGGSFFDVFFDVFFWASPSRPPPRGPAVAVTVRTSATPTIPTAAWPGCPACPARPRLPATPSVTTSRSATPARPRSRPRQLAPNSPVCAGMGSASRPDAMSFSKIALPTAAAANLNHRPTRATNRAATAPASQTAGKTPLPALPTVSKAP